MSATRDVRAVLDMATLDAGQALLGWHLVRDDDTGRRVGRIVEIEAYIGEDDRASHARFGRTARNEVMYGPPGRAYVYLVYGMHDCLNIITEPTGSPAALLVRALEPLEGLDAMRTSRAARADARRRATRTTPPAQSATERRAAATTADNRLAAGPGLVCAAFDIDRTLTGQDLFDPAASVRLVPPPPGAETPVVVASPRVGIGYADAPWTDLPWRLSIAANPSVSRPLPRPAG